MKRRPLAPAVAVALGFAVFAPAAAGEDLAQIYREALASDPVFASARATWLATQENVPQARAGLLPNVNLAASALEVDFWDKVHSDPSVTVHQRYPQYQYSVSASQPLYRRQNSIVLNQAEQQVGQADYVLASAKQDLVLRVTQAYLDILLAEFNIELTESQKAAVSENLAQAKRNFEVGVATITDTNDAQAKFDQIVAQEVAVRNDLDNKVAALRAIIGRFPRDLKRVERRPDPQLPQPNNVEVWIERAVSANPQVLIAKANFDIATLEVDRQRAAHHPTVDLVASYGQTYAGAASSTSISSNFASDIRQGQIAVQLNVPLYTGGLISSRVRQAVANQEAARQNLDTARRTAQLSAQTAFTGVSGGVAQIASLAQALTSAQVSYDSTKLGLEVGVRTNLDVLNQQQQVFQTRFNLTQAFYNYVISGLRLRAAVGTLGEQEVEEINRALGS